MMLWKQTIVPGIAALAVMLLGAAAASGVDQMANAKIRNPAPVTTQTVAADGQPPLRHLVLLGLAEGSLPGGFPYDEPREERYDENYQEKLHVEAGISAWRLARRRGGKAKGIQGRNELPSRSSASGMRGCGPEGKMRQIEDLLAAGIRRDDL